MRNIHYRVWPGTEEIDSDEEKPGKPVEKIEIAVFPTIEEALTYRVKNFSPDSV